MLKYLISSLTFFLCLSGNPSLQGQVTIYSENFDSYADGTTNGNDWTAGTPGKCDTSTDFDFEVINGAFQIRNVEGAVCGCPNGDSGNNDNTIRFGPFDISDYCNISVTMDAFPGIGLECHDNGAAPPVLCAPIPLNGRDVFHASVVIDGTPQDLLFYCGDELIYGPSLAGLNGNSLEIVVTSGAQGLDEQYHFDNVLIEGLFGPSEPINITSDKNSPICFGESITLTAQSPGPWNWNSSETTQSITVAPSAGSISYTVSVDNDCVTNTGTFPLIVFNPPVADAGPNQSICSGSSANLRARGGNAYRWEDGSTRASRTVSPTTTTTYTVTVTRTGCTDIDQVTVNVLPNPSASAGPDQDICPNTSTTLTASGGSTYRWSHGSTSASTTVNPTSSQTYEVTVTEDGCSDIATVNVNVKPLANVTINGLLEICEGASTTVTLSGADTYLWPNGSTDNRQELEPLTNTTYAVSVTDDGCTSVENVNIVVKPLPNVDAGTAVSICFGQDARLEASGGTNYVWDDGTQGAVNIVSPTSSETFSVTATLNGCQAADQVLVDVKPIPNAQIAPISTPCVGDNITLRASGGTQYNWDDNSRNASRDVIINTPTHYSVTVTSDGCSSIESIRITPNALPSLMVSADTNICRGQEAFLTADGPNITWFDGTTDNSTNVLPSETQYFSVEAQENGCISKDSIFVTLSEPFEVNLGTDQSVCQGESTRITTDNGIEFLWSNGQINSFIDVTPLVDTSFSVLATMDACSARDTIRILVNPLPIPEIVGELNYCPGSSTELSTSQTFESYNWSDGSNAPNVTINQAGNISVEVIDINGCIGISAAVEISENPNLNPVFSNSNTLCDGTTSVLKLNTRYDNYLWSDGSSADTLIISESDNYSVSVSTNDGCSGNTNIDIIKVLNPNITITGDTEFCHGDTSVLSVGDYPDVVWSLNNQTRTTEEISVSNPGPVQVTVIDENGCQGATSTIIEVNSNPTVSINGDQSFCTNDSTSIAITGNFNSLLWSDNELETQRTFTAPGTYSFIVSDSNNCTSDSSILIIENTLPNPTIIAQDSICKDAEITLDILEDYTSYLWNQQTAERTLTIDRGGFYSIQVSDNNGCIGSSNKEITEIDPPAVTFKEAITVCNFPSSEIDAPYQLNLDTVFTSNLLSGTWSSDDISMNVDASEPLDFSGITAGTYNLSFTTNDIKAPCQNLSFPLTINVRECQCPDIQFQGIETLCSLDDTLDLSEIQSSDFEGSWQIINAPTPEMPTITDDIFMAMDQLPGTYELEFRLIDGIAPLGCNESKSVNIVVAPHATGAINIIEEACPGSPALLDLSLAGAELFDVIIDTGSNDPIIFNNVSDGFQFPLEITKTTQLSFTNIFGTSGTCAFEASAPNYIIEPKEIQGNIEQINTYGIHGVSCNGATDGSLMTNILIGTAPYTYEWSTGSTEPSISNISAGRYNISVEDADGCTFSDSIIITQPEPIEIDYEVMDANCPEDDGLLLINNITDELSNSWELYLDNKVLGQSNQFPISIDLKTNGSYLLEVVNTDGCIASINFDVFIPDSLQINIEDQTARLGDFVALNPMYSFNATNIEWTPATYLDCTDCADVLAQPTESITYRITASDVNGCATSTDVQIDLDKERSLVVPTGFTANNDNINDALIVHGGSDIQSIDHIIIYNRVGEMVYEVNDVIQNQPVNWDWTFRGMDLPEGQYIYQISATFIDGLSQGFKGSFELIR